MANPRVTAIIVSYNRLELLRRAIDSALAQTLKDVEVLVIDNCSPSFDIFEALADYGDRIRVMRNTGNFGCGNARNVAVKEARGEFVAFLDDDDAWRPEKLQRQLEAIGDRPMCASGHELYPSGMIEFHRADKVSRRMLIYGNKVCSPSGFFCRKDLFETIAFDEKLYAEDWDFLIRVFQMGEIAYVPEPLYLYTVTTSGASMTSASRRMTWDQLQTRFAVADKHRAFLGEFHYHRRIAKEALSHISSRPDKLSFLAKSVGRAGLLPTALALMDGVGRKARRGLHRLSHKRQAA